MARLHIPQVTRPALARLANIPPQEFESIVDNLSGEEPLLARRDLTNRLLASVTSLDEDAAREFLDITLSLASLRVDQEMTVDELAEAVSASSDLQISDEERLKLKTRISALLDLPDVQHLAKAADVLVQSERSFHDAKVITDVRPVFADDPSEGPFGAIILHNLAIEFQGPSQIETWFVTLDERDLRRLREVLERAAQKGQTLHQFMGTAHLASFELME